MALTCSTPDHELKKKRMAHTASDQPLLAHQQLAKVGPGSFRKLKFRNSMNS